MRLRKLIDAFLTGTVPIYYGTDKIKSIFNPNGIIFINDINDMKNVFNIISSKDYEKRTEAILENFEIASKRYMFEYWINKNLKIIKRKEN